MASDTTYSLWGSKATPRNITDPDSRAVELGVKFKANQVGTITGVKFYKSSTNTGVHVGSLWTSNGALLAKATFADETASGWQTVKFDNPVAIQAGTIYVASYHAPNGHYSSNNKYFSKSRDRGPLQAPASTTSSPNGVYHFGSSAFPSEGYGSTNYWVDVLFRTNAPTPSAPPAPTATPASTPTPTPTPYGTPAPTPPPAGSWPSASNTGVPEGIVLSAYTGPCTITTAGTVIDSKTVNCGLDIRAGSVTIRKSKVTGGIGIDSDLTASSGWSVTIEDSEVDGGTERIGTIGNTNITVIRSDVHGGQASVQCVNNCTVKDSWLHGQYLPSTGNWHLDGFITNGGTNLNLTHNTIHCDRAPNNYDGGCSGNVGLFPDFAPVTYTTLDNNLFVASTGNAYCVYGGAALNKTYGAQSHHITLTNNVFQRGTNSKCGAFGAVSDFRRDDGLIPTGNVWTNNMWDDGTVLNP